MTGYLAGALSVHGYLSRHAAWFSVRQVVVAVIFVAVLVALVAGPLLLEVIGNLFSKGVERATPGGFVVGLVVLFVGLASGVRFIIIAGACVLGAVVLGVIIDKYLILAADAPLGRLAPCRPIAPKAAWPGLKRRYPGEHAYRRACAQVAAFRGRDCTPGLSRVRARPCSGPGTKLP